jgi:hypothetical protein
MMTEKERAKVDAAYWLFEQTEAGKLVLQDLRESYYDRMSHNVNAPDPLRTAFAEGERHVVQQILWTLEKLKE